MRLYDTARRAVVPFEPGPTVTMYTCGITPYDSAHVGHAAVYLTYDVLQRRLRDLGHVDAMRAQRHRRRRRHPAQGTRARRVLPRPRGRGDGAASTTPCAALGCCRAFSEPRATSAIPDILGFIGMVLDSGHAYQAGGAVYFSVGSFERFGQISHLDRETMLALAAERGGNVDDPNKRDPLDFVLWQPSAPDEPWWESLWGRGRPGWHIECSALAMRELGPTIDLHGGGSDLIYPHHECEAAQSEAATGEPFVRHWMHSAWCCLDGEKMSKSLGNLVFVGDLLKEWDPAAVRLAILAHHYRPGWEWNDALMPAAEARLASWRAAGPGDAALDERAGRLDDDLDTPAAIAAVDRPSSAGRRRVAMRPRCSASRCNQFRDAADTGGPVSLPDGCPHHHHAARRIHPPGGRGDDGGRSRSIDRQAPGQGRGRRRGRRRGGRPDACRCPTAPRSRIITGDYRRRPPRPAPLDRARAGAGGARRCGPGAKFAIGPRDRGRLLLRLRAARRRALHRGRPRAHRGAMREIVAADQPFVREVHIGRRGPRAVRRSALQVARSSRASTPPRAPATASSPPTATAPEFVDLCRGPHVPTHRPARSLQADAGRRRVLARRRDSASSSSASTAPRGSRRRRSTSTCTGSRRPRSATTASSAPSSTCSASRPRSAAAWPCSTPRAAPSAG